MLNSITLSSIFPLAILRLPLFHRRYCRGNVRRMSLYGYTTNRDRTRPLAITVYEALIGSRAGSLVDFWLKGEGLLAVTTSASAVGLTAYDTQKLKIWGD